MRFSVDRKFVQSTSYFSEKCTNVSSVFFCNQNLCHWLL